MLALIANHFLLIVFSFCGFPFHCVNISKEDNIKWQPFSIVVKPALTYTREFIVCILYQFPLQWLFFGSFKSFMVGGYTPQKSSNRSHLLESQFNHFKFMPVIVLWNIFSIHENILLQKSFLCLCFLFHRYLFQWLKSGVFVCFPQRDKKCRELS